MAYSKENNDGGSNAIRGFIYQFDASLLEALNNPVKNIQIEQNQDIGYDNYYIQVKYRTSLYQPSSINPAVLQLIKEHKQTPSNKFCLHCHFPDKPPQKFSPTTSDLDTILGKKSMEFSNTEKNAFIKNFFIQFGADFESQFQILIELIKKTYGIQDEQAVWYHAIFQSNTFNISIRVKKSERIINKTFLDDLINKTEKVVFYGSYSKYLGKDKYIKLINNQIFKFKSPNIEPFERLFIIECNKTNDSEVIEIINKIRTKFFKVDKSPAPYIYLRNYAHIDRVKQNLIDKNIYFSDGTMFHGDKFRIEKLTEKASKKNGIMIKLLNDSSLKVFAKTVEVDQVFNFFTTTPFSYIKPTKHQAITIKVESVGDIIKIIN